MIKNISDSTIAICALARNCEEQLRNNIPRIEKFRKNFSSSYIVIVENDSKDLTKQLLQQWELTGSNVNIISNNFNTVTIPQSTPNSVNPTTSFHRIEKMASYRNLYMDHIARIPGLDLVMVIDIDVNFFDPSSIVKTLQNVPKNWGGIFSFGYTDTNIFNVRFKMLYHDLYALMFKEPTGKTYLTFAEMFSNSKAIIKLLKHQEYVPVISAFGGIGLYKYEAISDLKYISLYNDDELMEAVCEHIPFNYSIVKKGYQNYVCKNLKVYYGYSNKLMLIRNLLPLKIFKLLALVFTFKKLKA